MIYTYLYEIGMRRRKMLDKRTLKTVQWSAHEDEGIYFRNFLNYIISERHFSSCNLRYGFCQKSQINFFSYILSYSSQKTISGSSSRRASSSFRLPSFGAYQRQSKVDSSSWFLLLVGAFLANSSNSFRLPLSVRSDILS